jgi:hypothetical protein
MLYYLIFPCYVPWSTHALNFLIYQRRSAGYFPRAEKPIKLDHGRFILPGSELIFPWVTNVLIAYLTW